MGDQEERQQSNGSMRSRKIAALDIALDLSEIAAQEPIFQVEAKHREAQWCKQFNVPKYMVFIIPLVFACQYVAVQSASESRVADMTTISLFLASAVWMYLGLEYIYKYVAENATDMMSLLEPEFFEQQEPFGIPPLALHSSPVLRRMGLCGNDSIRTQSPVTLSRFYIEAVWDTKNACVVGIFVSLLFGGLSFATGAWSDATGLRVSFALYVASVHFFCGLGIYPMILWFFFALKTGKYVPVFLFNQSIKSCKIYMEITRRIIIVGAIYVGITQVAWFTSPLIAKTNMVGVVYGVSGILSMVGIIIIPILPLSQKLRNEKEQAIEVLEQGSQYFLDQYRKNKIVRADLVYFLTQARDKVLAVPALPNMAQLIKNLVVTAVVAGGPNLFRLVSG